MRRIKASKRGRIVPILVAGGIGYLIGAWQTAGLRSTDLSATDAVAQRFPQAWKDASAAAPASAIAAARSASSGRATGGMQFALLSPEPMVPQQMVPQGTGQPVPQTAVQTAAPDQAGSSAAPAATAPQRPPVTAAPASEAKAAAVAARHRANRPGYMLNDAQIVSIKERLNLTPDQERMWPAVEAALRNIAYAHAQEEHRRGAASGVQAAAVDPDGVEVQGLKSAAVPLLMSFNAEQKEEVRNLAHVMGLDQLATQF